MKEQECHSMLSKVLIEREQLKEELEYERNVRGKDAESHSHITELKKQISEMQETEQRLRKQRDELDATAKRYRSERNAMRIGVVDALNRVQKKLQGKHREEDIITLNDVFATSLKIAHKDIEILQTYDNEGESATKVLIGLLKIYDRNCATSEMIKLLLSRIEL